MLQLGLTFAQKPQITAGPMAGYTTHREASVWVQTQNAVKISLVYWSVNKPDRRDTLRIFLEWKDVPQITSHHFVLENLLPGTTYKYFIMAGPKGVSSPECTIKTQVLWEHRTNPPPFSFMLGSCFYVNDSAYDRPGKPYGSSLSILSTMTSVKTDFMLWLGDNVYLREADYDSKSGCRYRYQHTRSRKELQPFLQSRHHYAIWDDHDYGPNDASSSYRGKEWTRELFIEYWSNQQYGQNGQGTYSNFTWNDAEFFLLDGRWFRDPDGLEDSSGKSMLGDVQFAWLLNSLLESKATFKFIVSGSQVLNRATDKESFAIYKHERDSLLSFIATYEIPGVVFLSGDRHHTEMLKWERPLPVKTDSLNQPSQQVNKEKDKKKEEKKKKKNQKEVKPIADTTRLDEEDPEEKMPERTERYPLYELTSSSITSGSSTIRSTPELNNPQRIGPTLVDEQNFCTISISGYTGNRSMLIKCFNAAGELKWELTLNESQLK